MCEAVWTQLRDEPVASAVGHGVANDRPHGDVALRVERNAQSRVEGPLSLLHMEEPIADVGDVVAESLELHDFDLRRFRFHRDVNVGALESLVRACSYLEAIGGGIRHLGLPHARVWDAAESIRVARDADPRHDSKPASGLKSEDRSRRSSPILYRRNQRAVRANPGTAVEVGVDREIHILLFCNGVARVLHATHLSHIVETRWTPPATPGLVD